MLSRTPPLSWAGFQGTPLPGAQTRSPGTRGLDHPPRRPSPPFTPYGTYTPEPYSSRTGTGYAHLRAPFPRPFSRAVSHAGGGQLWARFAPPPVPCGGNPGQPRRCPRRLLGKRSRCGMNPPPRQQNAARSFGSDCNTPPPSGPIWARLPESPEGTVTRPDTPRYMRRAGHCGLFWSIGGNTHAT